MQVIRTLVWIVMTAVVVGFMVMNWGQKVPVNFWPQDGGTPLHFDWPVAVIALFFLLIGFVPMWLYLRAVRWGLNRRIAVLESSLRTSNMPIGEKSLETAPAPSSDQIPLTRADASSESLE